jgi:hypothetical protein
MLRRTCQLKIYFQTIFIGENLKKLGPLFLAGGNVKYYSHFVKHFGSSSKSQLLYDPEIPGPRVFT